jgi:hypothetical protein
VACRGDATEACQSTEQCVDNQCVAQCPASCTTDAECSTCGTAGNEAHICHNHACAECSEDSDCPGGETCSAQGACIPTCGIPGQVAGVCETDNECAGCRGDIDQCNAPINGGHGVCGPSASGCSDLGNGVGGAARTVRSGHERLQRRRGL